MPPQAPQSREQFIKSLFVLENQDNIYSEEIARERLIKGVNKVVDTIKVSYGPAGSNTILEAFETPYHRVSNDGKLIADQIKLADSVENIGANIAKECSDKTDKESGAGRKTSLILLQAILKEGAKATGNPMEIKRSLDECLPIVLKSIDEQTKEIPINEIGKIAEIASESKMLGSKFQDIYNEIGKDGIIELDNSGISDTFYEVIDGTRLPNCTFQYPYMANEDKGRKAVFNSPFVLITKQKISSINDLDNILKQVKNKGKNELVIFCDEIDLSVSQALAFLHQGLNPITNQSIDSFKTLVIKAPVLWKDWIFEDFAKITKATIIDPAQGKTLKTFQYNWLGYCDRIIANKTETVVLGTQDISEHIKVLEEQNTDEAKIRIARLKTKTAILKIGANSESELSHLKGKALDARNETYLALNGGVVKGGGVCLNDSRFGKDLRRNLSLKGIGGDILFEALKVPWEQIQKNLGTETITFDYGKDIFDPAIVVKNALTNALSIASTILTTRNVITLKK